MMGRMRCRLEQKHRLILLSIDFWRNQRNFIVLFKGLCERNENVSSTSVSRPDNILRKKRLKAELIYTENVWKSSMI